MKKLPRVLVVLLVILGLLGVEAPAIAVPPPRGDDLQDDPLSWGLDRIDQRDLPLNQKFFHATSNVRAYVIDGGIRPDIAEFGGRVERGLTVDGKDCCTANEDGNSQHGTHVAGTLGGAVHGVAKNVRIVNVKARRCGELVPSPPAIVDAVRWVTQDVKDKKVPAVVSMSMGLTDFPEATVDAAVREAIAADITFVTSAGNMNGNACLDSPGRVREAITVAATARDDKRRANSNHGDCVDIFAPGEEIRSADSNNPGSSTVMSGTSMAAPHVAVPPR